MKKLTMVLCTVSTLLMAQDAAGNYKLSGLDVQYYMAARYATDIVVNDPYGAGISLAISQIQEGEIFYAVRNGPLSEAALSAINVNLNVNLYEDNTGAIAEGSFYPDQELIEGTCVSDVLVLPITDELIYESNANLNLPKYGVNVVGIPAIGASYHGTSGFGGLGLSQSVVFDYFSMIPSQPPLCDNAGNCVNLVYPGGSLEGFYACVGGGGDPAACAGANGVLPAGAPVPGVQVGYWKSESIHGDLGESLVGPNNTEPEFYLEWHAVDGAAAESGLGDLIGEDEDGDGTDFDRILGLPYITVTNMSAACGFNYPIFGDASAAFEAAGMGFCVEGVDVGIDAYVMDPSGALAQWGNFLTWHAVVAQQLIGQCVAAGGLENFGTGFCIQQATSDDFAAACDYAGVYAATYGLCMSAAGPGWEETCAGLAAATEAATGGNCAAMSAVAPTVCGMAGAALADGFGTGYGEPYDCQNYITQDHMYGADDSSYDSDPTCLADGDPLDCSGRIPMNFEPTCVPEIEIREVYAEFINVGDEGCGDGDMNSDGSWNVLDVVSLVNCVLNDTCDDCSGDVNGDGSYNVLDVVGLVNCVLNDTCEGDLGRADSAKSAEFNVIGNEVTMTADGYVGAVQMTLSHGSDFQINLTDNSLVAEYVTNGNTTELMIVEPADESLFTTNGDFTIESVIAASNGETYMQTTVNLPKDYSISAAYPNPFNPTTQMSLELNTDANVSIKVFNTMGQLVDVITEGQMAGGNYSFSWDATNSASGIYFIHTEVGDQLNTQKIMLVK